MPSHAQQQFIEHGADLGAGEHGAQAVVRSAAAERDMWVGMASDVECERRVEDFLVAIRRTQHRHHPLALGDVLAVHLDVDLGAASPVRDRRRPAQHLLDGAGSHGFVVAVPLDLFGIRDERLQSDGQRVLGGVAAGEREHEEEELEFVCGQAELLTVVAGDDAGRNRAPDVVGGVAPLFGGELHGVSEDRREDVGVAADPRSD